METPREGRSVSDAQVRRKLRPILGSICSHGVSRTLPPPTIARVSGAPVCGTPATTCMARGGSQEPSSRTEAPRMRDPCGKVQASDGALMVYSSIRQLISAAIPVEGNTGRGGSSPQCASGFPSIGQACRRLISPRRCSQSGSRPRSSADAAWGPNRQNAAQQEANVPAPEDGQSARLQRLPLLAFSDDLGPVRPGGSAEQARLRCAPGRQGISNVDWTLPSRSRRVTIVPEASIGSVIPQNRSITVSVPGRVFTLTAPL